MIHETALEAGMSPLAMETSTPFVGRWNRLVSTTNWEKGRIIVEWRAAMREADAPVANSTDEAWAQQVGGVTPQHVGRLRRVYERFAGAAQQYPGLYWSHFCTALDWSDAEMWLEGAVQNGWSISQMRATRSEALGVAAGPGPEESELFAADAEDEEVVAGDGFLPESIGETLGVVHEAGAGDEDHRLSGSAPFADDGERVLDMAAVAESAAPFRPFENLSAMPRDMQEAFELFKLSIIAQKLAGWQEIAMQDVLAILDALKQLARAPAG